MHTKMGRVPGKLMVDRDYSTTANSTTGWLASYFRDGSSSGSALLCPPLLIDLGFSADALDPLFDNGIFREPFPNRAEFSNSELRNELLAGMPWSRKRRLCEQVGELLSERRGTLDEAADFFCRAHRYGNARNCCVGAAKEACHSGQYTKAFSLFRRAIEIWPAGEDADKRTHTLKEMARCARHAREFGAAQLAWEEILATWRASGSAEGEIEAHNQIAELSQVLGDHAGALSSLREAAELSLGTRGNGRT
jgi:tetratricopeptide (TPR) repeat protein